MSSLTINDTITKFGQKLDLKYEIESISAHFAIPQSFFTFTEYKKFKMPKITSLSGDTNYDITTGFTPGSAEVEYEEKILRLDRQQSFFVDSLEAQQTNFNGLALMMTEHERLNRIPEQDAHFFSQIYADVLAGAPTHIVDADTIANPINALIDARTRLRKSKVKGKAGLVVSADFFGEMQKDPSLVRQISTGTIVNPFGIVTECDYFNGMPIHVAPDDRFVSEIEFVIDGNGGYNIPNTAYDINFMIITYGSAFPLVPYSELRYFPTAVNQKRAADEVQSRKAYDAYTFDNKLVGIYINRKTTARGV